jgi:hypothetical protein
MVVLGIVILGMVVLVTVGVPYKPGGRGGKFKFVVNFVCDWPESNLSPIRKEQWLFRGVL